MTGIEAFVRLEILNVLSNQLGTIDISKNNDLQQVYLMDNQLTVLDLSNLENVVVLFTTNNQLTCIEVNESQLEATKIMGPDFLWWWGDEAMEYSLDCN